MKQFITCTVFTVLLYFIGCILAESFNPMEWQNKEATVYWGFFVLAVWFIPMMFNYLDGKENFTK